MLLFHILFLMVAFSVFGISIYRYGIFYFVSFLLGYLFFCYIKKYNFLERYSPNFYALLKKSPEDIVLYVVLGGLVGGRLGHIFIYDFQFYLRNPLHVFSIWEGGMSFIGGILGAIVAIIIVYRKYSFSKNDFLVFTDLLILPTSFGIMLGRIGNFLNQELYGRVVSDIFPNLSSSVISVFSRIGIFHVYDSVDGSIRINTNFLSSFFEGFVMVIFSGLFLYNGFKKKRRSVGFLSSLFLMWYSFVRFMFEYIRLDSQSEYIWLLTKSQWFFLIFFVIGLGFIYLSAIRKSYMK